MPDTASRHPRTTAPSGVGAGQLFLSHSARDNKLSARVKRMAEKAGYHSLFLDFDPELGIPPGRDWERELYAQLERCDAVIALDSPDWRRSRWCTIEIALARMLHKPILPLTDRGATVRGKGSAALIGDTQAFSLKALLGGRDDALWQELQRLGIQAGERFDWDPSRSPYPGLVPMQVADAGVFFGRSEETHRSMEALERFTRMPGRRILLIVGPSGSGKSSLLKAGLIPVLARRPHWTVLELGERPPALKTLTHFSSGVRTVLVADQLDERLAAPESQRDAWAKGLHRLLSAPQEAFMVGTIRSDSLARFQSQFPQWLAALETVLVGPMTREGWRAVIEEPARKAAVPIERALVDALLAEVAPRQAGGDEPISADSLPLLATMMRQLWERRDAKRGLTLKSWRQLGGLTGAVGDIAEACIDNLRLDDTDIATLRRHLVAMLHIERNGQFTRRPLSSGRFEGQLAALRDAFIAQGLLVEGRVPGHVELAHEALVRTWPRLAQWADEAREQLRRRDRFEQALLRWQEHPQALLDNVGLVEAEALLAGGDLADIDAKAAETLIESSRRLLQEAKSREAERVQSIAVSESLRLATEGRELLAEEPDTALRLAWEAVLWQNNEVSEALFREALTRLPAPTRILTSGEEIESIGSACDGSYAFAAVDGGSQLQLWSWAGEAIHRFSSGKEGRLAVSPVPNSPLLSVLTAGKLCLFDKAGQVIDELQLSPWQEDPNERPRLAWGVPATPAATVAVAQHGPTLWSIELRTDAVAPKLHMRTSWPVVATDRAQFHALQERVHEPWHRVTGLDINLAGTQVLTHGSDGRLIVSSLDGAWLWLVDKHSSDEYADACFTADDRVISGSLQGDGRVASADGTDVEFRKGAQADLYIRSFDRARRRFVLAEVREREALEVRDADGSLLFHLIDQHGNQRAATFSDDGRWIASGGNDRLIRIWSNEDGRLCHTLDGHADSVTGLAFGPQGELLSQSRDGSVRMWWLDRPVLPTLIVPSSKGAAKVELNMQTWGDLTWTAIYGSDATAFWRGLQQVAVVPGLPLKGGEGQCTWASLDAAGKLRFWKRDDWSRPVAELNVSSSDLRPGYVRASADGAAMLIVPEQQGADPLLWRAGHRLTRLKDTNPEPIETSYHRILNAGFHPDGRCATGHRSGRVNLWTADGQLYASLQVDRGSPDALRSLQLHPQGLCLATGARNAFKLWDWNAQHIRECAVGGYKVERLMFNTDGTRLLSVSDNPSGDHVVEWWDGNGRRLGRLHWPGVNPFSRWWAGSVDQGLVAATDDTLYEALDPTQPPKVFRVGRGKQIRAMALDPAGMLIALLLSDGQLRLWSRTDGRVVLRLRTSSSGPIAFSGDGKLLFVGLLNGSVEPHALGLETLFEAAAERLGAGFSAADIERFGLREPVRLNAHTSIERICRNHL